METRVIAVISGKGGVGKTTTVANLGASLTSLGVNCLLIDGNIDTPNLALHLGITDVPVSLQDILGGKTDPMKAVIRHPQTGISLIASSLKYQAADMRGLRHIIPKLAQEYEMIIIDSPPGIIGHVEDIVEEAHEILVVSTPDIPSIVNAAKAVKLAKEIGVQKTGIIINRVHGHKFELKEREAEYVSDSQVIAIIPEDSRVQESLSNKVPVVLFSPRSASAIRFKQLAAYVGNKMYVPEKPQGESPLAGIISFFKGLFGKK